jgi:hypothetical protein
LQRRRRLTRPLAVGLYAADRLALGRCLLLDQRNVLLLDLLLRLRGLLRRARLRALTEDSSEDRTHSVP